VGASVDAGGIVAYDSCVGREFRPGIKLETEMSKTTLSILEANAELTRAITEAIKAAGEAGMDAADIVTVLTRLAELTEE
jgi:hypothetical protein